MSRSLRIAVADDESDMQEYYRTILPVLGHVVVAVAETGRELIEKCREQHPDLVITDIKMPDMDGIDAAMQIYRDGPIPIILVSAFHDADLIRRAEGEPHSVLPGQADQAGRPRTGHRDCHATIRAVSGASPGDRRSEAGTRGPEADRAGQGTADEKGRRLTRRTRFAGYRSSPAIRTESWSRSRECC